MVAASSADHVRVLVVHLDGVRYALPLAEVVEVLPAAAVVPLPGAPEVVEGLLNVRGTPVPVVDLRARTGLPGRTAAPGDHLVACQVRGRVVAARVDRAEEVVSVDSDDLRAIDEVAAASHLAGVTRTADGLLLVYDVASFLSAEEILGLDRALELTPVGAGA